MNDPHDPHDPHLAPRIDLMLRLGQHAAEIAMAWFQRPDLPVQIKPDDSPVTHADTAIEAHLRQQIAAAFPHDGLLGEELGHPPHDPHDPHDHHDNLPSPSDYTWILDPIDGTVSFAAGVPLFATLIAIHHRPTDRIVAGLCQLPALGERVWAAEQQGAWWDRPGHPTARARVATPRHPNPLRHALISTTSAEYYHRAGRSDVLARLHTPTPTPTPTPGLIGRLRGFPDAYALALAATGRIDAVIEPWMMPWDAAPFAIIFPEAGGIYRTWTSDTAFTLSTNLLAPTTAPTTALAGHPDTVSALLPLTRQA
jgi:fructose-1,6-bisphosphatase/inositol monophosphatase family enzyme